ncbi:MAG: hypothetical protein Q4D31_02440 [Eubacteriales bacterium]|nr:hypothetical protein [Eubacteriales bacterium]
MKLRRFAMLLCGLILLGGLPVCAQGATRPTMLMTTVPSSHTVTVRCQGQGELLVDGAPCAEHTFTVERLQSLTITLQPAPGYELDTVTTTADITSRGERLTLEAVHADDTVTIAFRKASASGGGGGGSSASPDPVTPSDVPDVPTVPDVPDTPDTPTVPDTPDVPTVPDVPDVPAVPDAPSGLPDGAAPRDRAPAPVNDPLAVPAPLAIDPAAVETPTEAPTETADPALPPADAPDAPLAQSVPLLGDGGQTAITVDRRPAEDRLYLHADEAAVRQLMQQQKSERVSLDLRPATRGQPDIVLPYPLVDTVSRSSGIELKMEHAALSFDRTALQSIATQAEGEQVSLHVVEIGTRTLSERQRQAMQQAIGRVVVTVHLAKHTGERIERFDGGTATISLPYTPQTDEDTGAIEVWYLPPEGGKQVIPCRYEDGQIMFVVDHFSEYAIIPGPIGQAAAAPAQPSYWLVWLGVGALLLWLIVLIVRHKKEQDAG